MAKREEITITIDSKGDMSAKVDCGPGGAMCETMLEELLGTKATESKKLPEYYQKRQTVGKAKIGKGR